MLKCTMQRQGEAEYQGKLLESRGLDWKDEFIDLVVNSYRDARFWSDNPTHGKDALFFEYFSNFHFGIRQFSEGL